MDDLISRQAAMEAMAPFDTDYELRDTLESLPPGRESGEWVEIEDYNGDVHYKCDQCGEEWTFPHGTPKENNANFCPNCGADMREKGANNA